MDEPLRHSLRSFVPSAGSNLVGGNEVIDLFKRPDPIIWNEDGFLPPRAIGAKGTMGWGGGSSVDYDGSISGDPAVQEVGGFPVPTYSRPISVRTPPEKVS